MNELIQLREAYENIKTQKKVNKLTQQKNLRQLREQVQIKK